MNARQRADVYDAIHRLLYAGMPGADALAAAARTVKAPLQAPLRRAATLAGTGKTVEASLRSARIADERDLLLIGSAELSGDLEGMFKAIARRHRARAVRSARMKTQFAYPVVLLVLTVFIAPLPALVGGAIGAGGYIARTFVPLIALAIVVRTLGVLTSRAGSADAASPMLGLLSKLPIIGAMIHARCRADYLDTLARLLVCGLPAREALVAAGKVVPGVQSRGEPRAAPEHLDRGLGLSEALLKAGLLDSREGFPLLAAAEQAGRLDEAMLRHATDLGTRHDENLDLIATWLPRIGYFLVVGLVAASLLA